MLLHLIRFKCGSSSVVLSGHDGLKANVLQTVGSHVVDQVMVFVDVLVSGVSAQVRNFLLKYCIVLRSFSVVNVLMSLCKMCGQCRVAFQGCFRKCNVATSFFPYSYVRLFVYDFDLQILPEIDVSHFLLHFICPDFSFLKTMYITRGCF